jgi:hypothetical protein
MSSVIARASLAQELPGIALVVTAVTSLVFYTKMRKRTRRNFRGSLKNMRLCCIELSYSDK